MIRSRGIREEFRAPCWRYCCEGDVVALEDFIAGAPDLELPAFFDRRHGRCDDRVTLLLAADQDELRMRMCEP